MKKPFLALVFAVLPGLLLQSGCAGKPIPAPVSHSEKGQALTGSLKVHRFELDNGLKLLVLEDHSSPTFAYHTWFKVGSMDEREGYTGLAHLFEHMMFKGTKNHPEGDFDRILEEAGVQGENAFTSNDYTAYVQELPADKLELIAALEADRMVNLIVNEESFKTEREVVHNERRLRKENNPSGKMFEELFGTAYEKHAYRWPVIGYEQDLNRMTAKDAAEFYTSYYSPSNATVVVAGAIKPEQALTTVKKYYGKIPGRVVTHPAATPEPEQTATRKKILKLNIQVEQMLMAYHIPAVDHADIPAINLLNQILLGGKSSRLDRALVDTGIATSVGGDESDGRNPALTLISVSLQRGKSAAQAETVILRELARLSREPVGKAELERAKNGLSFQFYSGLTSNSGRARFLGTYETLLGDFAAGARIHEKTLSLNAADVQAAAKRYFHPNKRTVIIGVPK